DKYDGFLIPYSSLSQYVSTQEFRSLLAPVFAKPCIVIGSEEPGFSCVLPDSASGVELLAKHLIADHDVKRFVLVRGLVHHIVSNIREGDLPMPMSTAGLPDTNLTIINNSFIPELAGEIVDTIQANKLVDPTPAVIFISQPQAVATLSELLRR